MPPLARAAAFSCVDCHPLPEHVFRARDSGSTIEEELSQESSIASKSNAMSAEFPTQSALTNSHFKCMFEFEDRVA
jgi:hypothetical protein